MKMPLFSKESICRIFPRYRQLQKTISHLEARNAALAESEKKYRYLFENGSDLICIHDLHGNITDTNIQYKTEYGWSRTELLGKNIRDFIPSKYQLDFDDYLLRIRENGKDEGYLTAMTRSGKKVILEYRNILVLDENNQPSAVHGSARDVTQRVMAEKALQESQEKYRNLVQYAPAGIYDFDMNSLKFLSVNDVMCQYSGYSEAELLKLNPFDLLSDDSKETLKQVVETVFAQKPRQLTTEYRIKGKNKKEFWVLSNTRFFYEDGVPRHAMAVIHDMTDIRRAEEERRQLEIQLQQAHKMEAIGTLAGGIAHDFNNILAGILGYCELVKQHLHEPDKARKQIDQIYRGAKRAADLVKQILSFSRNTPYEKQPQNLGPIIKEAMTLLRSSIPATIAIQEQIHSQNTVLADPAKIHQIVMNLCTNAYHAMDTGGGILSIQLTDETLSGFTAAERRLRPGKYVRFTVSDTGHGMDAPTLERIFDPYFTTKDTGRGTGMGLSMVYAIVKEHQGAITADSSPGNGATFDVYLPVTRQDPAPPAAIDDRGTQHHARVSARGHERIMVVDDEESILESTRELLLDYGYLVNTFADGQTAMDAFMADPHRFDLIITDMTMPKMTGEDLARSILNIRPDLPVILCTGYNERMSEASALKMGISRFVQKPLIHQPLPDIIRDVLDHTGPPGAEKSRLD